MVKMIMHGCNGAMGQVITKLVSGMDDIEIVAGIDRNNIITSTYPVFADWESCTVDADVVVDFASVKAIDGLLEHCERKQMPLVLCTTGLSDAQIVQVEESSKQVAILRSANMSLGINTLLKLLQDATKVLAPAGFDIEIVEKHHKQKLDAPSGTAIALADAINEAVEENYEYTYDRSKERKKREEHEIGISAVRGGTIVGEHDVIFAGTDEVITFSHTAYSKAIFAKGAIEAAKYLAGKDAGFYTMADVIASR